MTAVSTSWSSSAAQRELVFEIADPFRLFSVFSAQPLILLTEATDFGRDVSARRYRLRRLGLPAPPTCPLPLHA